MEEQPLFNGNESLLFAKIKEELPPMVRNELRRAAAVTGTPSQLLMSLAKQNAVDAFKLLVKHGLCHIDGEDIHIGINNIRCKDELDIFVNQLKLIILNDVTLVFLNDADISTANRHLLNKVFHYSCNIKIYGYIVNTDYINKDFTPSSAQSNNFRYAKLLAVSRIHAGLFDKKGTPPVAIRRWLSRRGLITPFGEL